MKNITIIKIIKIAQAYINFWTIGYNRIVREISLAVAKKYITLNTVEYSIMKKNILHKEFLENCEINFGILLKVVQITLIINRFLCTIILD